MRFWLSGLVTLLLGACALQQGPSEDSPIRQASIACQRYSQAWVEHFRANVAVLEQNQTAAREQLAQAKTRLQQLEEPAGCFKPYCMIQPKAEGRLDTYCGYKVPDPSGAELYRWILWTDLN